MIGPSSLGGGDNFSPTSFRGTRIFSSPRYKELDRREQFFENSQHDHCEYDWDGHPIALLGPGALASIPLLSARVAPGFVPLRARRPSTPYRLPRVMVGAFTNMVFGSQRFPSVRVEGDEAAQDFATQLMKSSYLGSKMIRARNIGGSCGTVGLSWCYDRKGRPRVEVHRGKNLFVHEWDDREELIPRHVTEVFLERRADRWDPQKKKYVVDWFWRRHDWTENEDILFLPQLYRRSQEPQWVPDPQNSFTHDDGFCHFVWIQNLPTDDVDGEADYEGLYEKFCQLDILNSVLVKGGVLNLDPTLVLQVDQDEMSARNAMTGSDHVLPVGLEGDAKYLELAGTSLETGIKLLTELRRGALETAQCVVPDPQDAAGPDVSGVAQRQKYAPMIGKCEILREQYGRGLKTTLDQMMEVARVRASEPVLEYLVDPETGEMRPIQTQYVVALPPRAEKVKPAPDPETGEPPLDPETGEAAKESVQLVPRNPGSGGELELVWPPYFPPTPADQQAAVTALSTAVGGKAVLSQETAVEQLAMVYGVEPDEEWERVQGQNATDQAAAEKQAGAFGGQGAGGPVGDEKEPPGGGGKPRFGGSTPPFGKSAGPGGDQDDDAGSL